jgi:aryl-alcohol dehydrogenase-like predicted oxidoreductase
MKHRTAAKDGPQVAAIGLGCMACCDASLARLGVDHINLYYQRRVDPGVPIDEVLAQDKDIIPIPGAKRRKYLEENAAAIDMQLTRDDLAAIVTAVSSKDVAGERYPAQGMKAVNRQT